MIRGLRLGLLALACFALSFDDAAHARAPFVLFPSAVKVRIYGAPTATELNVDRLFGVGTGS